MENYLIILMRNSLAGLIWPTGWWLPTPALVNSYKESIQIHPYNPKMFHNWFMSNSLNNYKQNVMKNRPLRGKWYSTLDFWMDYP